MTPRKTTAKKTVKRTTKRTVTKTVKRTVKQTAEKRSTRVKQRKTPKQPVQKKPLRSTKLRTKKESTKSASVQQKQRVQKTIAKKNSAPRTQKDLLKKRSSSSPLPHHARALAYNRPLIMLPFDHRASFSRDLLNITSALTPEQHTRVQELKQLVYDAFTLVASERPDRASYAVLADEEYASSVLREARREGYTIAMPVEKSGQDEFQFDTPHWREAIERINPHIVKALVRYNPRGDAALNRRQRTRLRDVAEYCHRTHRLFLFELLVPPTSAQRNSYGEKYDAALRPALAAEAIREIQPEVAVDIWKVEAVPREDWDALISASKRGTKHTQPVFIVLGRNAPEETVEHWLRDAAPHDEAVGFAVGRTVFYEPLQRYIHGKVSRQLATRLIAARFRHFSGVWRDAKKAHPPKHTWHYTQRA